LMRRVVLLRAGTRAEKDHVSEAEYDELEDDYHGAPAKPISPPRLNRLTRLTEMVTSLGRNPRDGLMLYWVRYWYQFASIERGDHVWIIKSAEEWADETGM